MTRLALTLCLIYGLLTGCQTSSIKDPIIGRAYKPSNFNRLVEELPKQIRRVAVLPIHPSQENPNMIFGAESLQSELLAQLIQSGRFEVVNVPQKQLRIWTGRDLWTAEEKLPQAFFKQMRDELACDVVLFCRLTVYQPFPPLRVGWNIKLVDAKDSKIWWSTDEVFDSGRADVSNAARVFSQEQAREGASTDDSQAILTTPTRFARYTLQSLFGTLPKR